MFEKQAQVRALLFDKAFSEVSVKYSDYINVFLIENLVKLPKNIKINEYTIKLEAGKQPPFEPIYSLGLIKLEILKTYIETNLTNNFI